MADTYAIGMYANGYSFELLIRSECPWEDEVKAAGEDIAKRLGFEHLYTTKQEPTP